MNNPKSPILTGWKEIAEYLHINQQTARAWAKEHNLPVSKIGYGTAITTVHLLQIWVLENYEKGE